MKKAKATIVFTTHNRKDMLRKAINSAQKQSVELDIIVMDDASSDGTDEMMQNEFSSIDYHRSHISKGPCYHRNKGIELSKTKIVFPLDDDSILESPDTIQQTLDEFDEQTAIVAIPFINILQNQEVNTKSPDSQETYLTHAFIAASHAVDREKFLSVKGYRDFFFYMGEEGDVSIRLLQKKYLIKLGNADPIHHLQPPNRISKKADIFGRQNDILFVYLNAPSIYLIPYLLGTLLKGCLFGIKVSRLKNMLIGFYQGLKLAILYRKMRFPVNRECFLLYRNLKKETSIPFSNLKLYFQ